MKYLDKTFSVSVGGEAFAKGWEATFGRKMREEAEMSAESRRLLDEGLADSGAGRVVPLHFDREVDGRWIAEAINVPGAMAYGATPDEAADRATAIAVNVVLAREVAVALETIRRARELGTYGADPVETLETVEAALKRAIGG